MLEWVHANRRVPDAGDYAWRYGPEEGELDDADSVDRHYFVEQAHNS